MSRLRKLPSKHTCQAVYGAFGKSNPHLGQETVCGEPAFIWCNACKEYFCEACWEDHYEMTTVRILEGSKGTGMGMFSAVMAYRMRKLGT